MDSFAKINSDFEFTENYNVSGSLQMQFTNISSNDLQNIVIRKLGKRNTDPLSTFCLITIYVVVFVTGVFGNLTTCVVIQRNKFMHSITNFYLSSLAVADLLIIVLGEYFVYLFCH